MRHMINDDDDDWFGAHVVHVWDCSILPPIVQWAIGVPFHDTMAGHHQSFLLVINSVGSHGPMIPWFRGPICPSQWSMSLSMAMSIDCRFRRRMRHLK